MAEKFKEMPTAERERKLWEASQEYLRGKIEVDEFDNVEEPYVQKFKKENITSTKLKHVGTLSSTILIVIFIIIIFGGFIIFVYTRDQLVILLPSILIYPLFKLMGFNFPIEKDKGNGS
jgi:hypothetical protein